MFVEKQLKNIKNIKSWFGSRKYNKIWCRCGGSIPYNACPSRDAKLKSNCPSMLDVIMEYLFLEKFMDGIMDKQCDRNGGT
jgi:hypothetical protein